MRHVPWRCNNNNNNNNYLEIQFTTQSRLTLLLVQHSNVTINTFSLYKRPRGQYVSCELRVERAWCRRVSGFKGLKSFSFYNLVEFSLSDCANWFCTHSYGFVTVTIGAVISYPSLVPNVQKVIGMISAGLAHNRHASGVLPLPFTWLHHRNQWECSGFESRRNTSYVTGRRFALHSYTCSSMVILSGAEFVNQWAVTRCALNVTQNLNSCTLLLTNSSTPLIILFLFPLRVEQLM
jgi:hypothetical protein